MATIRIRVSLPANLIEFAEEEARRRGTTRSGLIAALLEGQWICEQTRRYVDQYGWDVADDEEGWRRYQRRGMAKEYRDDKW